MNRRPCNVEQNHIEQQVREDTCEAHGVFCCPECFDMEPIDPNEDRDPDWMNE